jgi:rSAM/selenodomain-associated transferase 2
MVTIIIPVLNEEKTIIQTLQNVSRLVGEKEIIVVDGGSTDKTVELARTYARVIQSEKGRAKQMNAGAKIANSNILWFIHSDSVLEPNSLEEIEKAIDEGYIGGFFQLYFYDLETIMMKFIATTSNWRARYLKLIFGDQGTFMRKDIFETIGGYKNMDLMEDWDLSQRIHKVGKMKKVKSKIGTSARRFEQGGPLRILLKLHRIKILYMLGVQGDKLARIYKEVR